MKLRRACCILLLSAFCLLADEAAEPRWQTLNHAARQAVEAKDYAKLHATLLELKQLMPGNPRITYNLAASEARLGQTEAALAGLRNLANMRLYYDLAADDDFAPLLQTGAFAAIRKQMDENKKPLTQASLAFTLPQRDLLPEDIAYDPRGRRFLVSSVRYGTITTVDGKPFAKSEWPILALAVDSQRGILWATTGWVPHCAKCLKTDEGKTALLAFDLGTGARKQRIDSPVQGLLGDMTISRGGALYISEGIHGGVFALPVGSGRLQRLDVAGEFPSPQTPALSADEKTLYVPDYLRGIAAMDLATRKVEWLRPADDIALNGIDGLYVYGDSFLAVQNGTNPPRIMRFSLDLQKQEVLAANSPGLGEPTHGTIVGGTFYFTANTGWSQYDENGQKKAGGAPVESYIWKVTPQAAYR